MSVGGQNTKNNVSENASEIADEMQTARNSLKTAESILNEKYPARKLGKAMLAPPII